MNNERISPINLRTDWKVFKGEDGNVVYAFSQQFPPDGNFVEISIRQRLDKYEIWSVSEHRISGPYENLVGTVHTLSEALKLAEEQLRAWEKRLLGTED